MIALSTALTGLSEPIWLVALILLVFGALQCERLWTRARRRSGREPGALAYLLDGLVIVGTVLVLVGAATLFLKGLTTIAAMLGGLLNNERVGPLVVGIALALGLALVLARIASGRRAAQDSVGAGAMELPSIYPALSATEVDLADLPEQQLGDGPPQVRIEEQSVPALSMMRERWQPAAATAASVPTSFLDLAEPRAQSRTRSRFALASTLLTLALVVMLVGGAVLFRRPLIDMLAGVASNATAGPVSGASSVQPAANVGAVAASVASAPTAASRTATAAPLPTSAAQGAAQKRVISNGLNLRAQPGTDQQVIVVLKQGDLVTVFNDARLIQGATWVKVRAGELEGWVDQSLLE
jgi:hypothetical protein